MPRLRSLAQSTRHSLEQCGDLYSPWKCVQELVRNSVDAGATSVAVRLDLGSTDMRLQVVDDGLGLERRDLRLVGRSHWVRAGHRGRGRTLASLRHAARHLTLASRAGGGGTFAVTFSEGRRGEVEREPIMRRSSGTTVTVDGFLWNRRLLRLAVREVSEVYRVRQGLLALALARPGLRLSLRNDSRGRRELLLNIGRHRSVSGVFREAFGAVEEGGLVASMKKVDHREGEVRVSGVICTEP